MAFQCNIDQRGRTARLVMGVMFDTIGVALLVAGVLQDNPYLWVPGIVVMLGGSFAIFEAAAGWCALRALGVKTKI